MGWRWQTIFAKKSRRDSADASIQQHEDYIEKRWGRLISATRKNTDDTRIKRTEMNRKQKLEEKQICRHLKRLSHIHVFSCETREKTWMRLRKGNLKKETESLLIVSKVGDRSRGRPEGSLFSSYYTEVSERALLLSLDFSTLSLIRTLYCWVLSKEPSSTILKVFGMTWPGIEPKSPGLLVNTLPTRHTNQGHQNQPYQSKNRLGATKQQMYVMYNKRIQ